MRNRSTSTAFARTDLLVLLAMLGVFAVLFATSRTRAGVQTSASVCLENMRQLSVAWSSYAADHDGRLVPNMTIPGVESSIASKTYLNWANNVMDWSNRPYNTNQQLTASSQLSPYLKTNVNVFHCPSDVYVSPLQRSLGWTARVRSYSMNASLGIPSPYPSATGAGAGISDWCPARRQFLNLATISHPSSLFVFLEEHPDSINDGLFLLTCDPSSWEDMPAAFHDGACSFAFADGHVELHPWLYDRTKAPVKLRVFSGVIILNTEKDDYQWVSDRTSVKVSELAVERTGSNWIQISWSQLPTNYLVQAIEELSSGTWTNTGIAPTRSPGQNSISVPAQGSQRFFRLRR